MRLNINALSTVITNFGILDIDDVELNAGLIYPKGSGKTAVFQSGLLWGAVVDTGKRVGGSVYRSGLQPGRILSPGLAEAPDLPKNRAYRVRPDYATASLETELIEEMLHEDTIRARYERDWMEWPAAEGAPYRDADGDGFFDPAIDTPGVPGAGQTIWYVANDLDSVLVSDLYGSRPFGIEVQVTVWAYAEGGSLGQMFFRRYLLINKSLGVIDSMYVSPWSDPDIGSSGDDYVGCDTTMALGFSYNANDTDATYSPLPPPAAGFLLLKGPRDGSTDLGMTGFYYYSREHETLTDPTQGSTEGAAQFYNYLMGRIGRTGEPYIDPNTNQPTVFPLAGDPVTGTGWIDGKAIPAGDRRLGLSSGPFKMAPGDSQEVVVAEILGGATPGVDHLSAVGLVKFYAAVAKAFYDSAFNVTGVDDEPARVPARFELSQNYPNPFNPVTTISYVLPADGRVRLVVVNILGQEVAVLADGPQEGGPHSAVFDATRLPSGVYVCKLVAGGETAVRKMVVMK